MMSLMVGDGAIDGDVVGDYDDHGRGWGTCKCLLMWVHASLFLSNFLYICLNKYFSTLDQLQGKRMLYKTLPIESQT